MILLMNVMEDTQPRQDLCMIPSEITLIFLTQDILNHLFQPQSLQILSEIVPYNMD